MAKKPKMTADEKKHRQLARKAKKKNEKIAEKMPLFVDVMPKHSAESEYWRWRKQLATRPLELAGTVGLAYPLLALEWVNLMGLAQHYLDIDDFAKLADYIHHTYPAVDYWISAWRDVLTGARRIPVSIREEFDVEWVTQYNRQGRRIFEVYLPRQDWKPPFTREQLKEFYEVKPLECPDDSEIWAKFQQSLTRRTDGD